MNIRAFRLAALCLLLCGSARAYVWSSAVPTEVHVVPEGLVLVGSFNNAGVSCATGAAAVFLPASDPNFKSKLAMALTASTLGRRIEVLIADPVATNCVQISAHGWVPVAYHYYWRLLP
jgi:hypothetical protein